MKDHDDRGAVGGSGGSSVAGFDYQVAVSIWLALDLMVASKLTSEMTLEHVSEEDLEADLEEIDREESEPEKVTTAVPMRNYRLIVQAKRRTTNAWTEKVFINLLEHGKKRKSAIKRLEEDPSARYLLVTSAAANSPVNKLTVRRPGHWPIASKMPTKVAKATKATIGGRVAIVASEDDERLEMDIRELLIRRFGVPFDLWETCLDVLKGAAWDRVRGKNDGRWTREEVEEIISNHEGYILRSSDQDLYVPPTNFGDLKQAIKNRHALIIVGQSGSGKTSASEALWHALRKDIPGLRRVHVTKGPDQLRTDMTRPPVLYDIEDPWGKFRFEPDSRPWNEQLESEFRSARHDRLFIATSRIDVAAGSGALGEIARWRVDLDAEHYGKSERKEIFRKLLALEPHDDLRTFAHSSEKTVLSELTLPLEIRKFFDALQDADREEIVKSPDRSVHQLIAKAHSKSIEKTVVNQIEHRKAVKAAAIIWALIKPLGRLSADVLRMLEDPLAEADEDLEGKLDELVGTFVVARNLRQAADGSLSYYHGKVEAGFETALNNHPQPVRLALKALVEILLGSEELSEGDWGIETAVEIMRLAGQRLKSGKPRIGNSHQARIDAWLEHGMADLAERALNARLDLAASVGSSRSNLSELGRWLKHRRDHTFKSLLAWKEPDRDGAWYARMRSDPHVKAVLEQFIRTTLPSDNVHFPESFHITVRKLAGDLTEAFTDAATRSIYFGVITNDDTIAAGALENLSAFESVVDGAVRAYSTTDEERQRSEENHLLIVNEEISEDYAEHLQDNDDGYTADKYLKAYVEAVRAGPSFTHFLSHRHLEALRPRWLRSMVGEDAQKPTAQELEAAYISSYGSGDEGEFWAALDASWMPSFAERLERRLKDSHPDPSVRSAALRVALRHWPQAISSVIAGLPGRNDPRSAVELAIDLANVSALTGSRRGTLPADAKAQIAALPEVLRQIGISASAIQHDDVPFLGQDGVEFLLRIEDAPDDVRRLRLELALRAHIDVRQDVELFIMEGRSLDDALLAIKIAIARGMADVVSGALRHRYAKVAAEALTAVVAPMAGPLPKEILSLGERKSSPTRKALLVELQAKPHVDHLEALMTLVRDDWSKYSPRGSDDGNYPIARGAVDLILDLPSLDDQTVSELIDLAKSTEDRILARKCLGSALRHGSDARRAEVFQMSQKGKRLAVGEAASGALLNQVEYLSDELVSRITPESLISLPASIADSLVIVVGMRGTTEAIDKIATALCADQDRRLFLALLARVLRERDPEYAERIASLLPSRHPARHWAAGSNDEVSGDALIDLGDAATVKEVLHWITFTRGAE
ncbi:hypothetical protein [Sinorhizobium mexicanum]|uniref:Uncharacterized protein n=1 Tax=Sinorhizobium mexicanum TaxID=375549 RepID=A0A859QQ91_9HYPH|nr:hypothetical protein [Sinorhizobium mexicanum]MBP1884984.1 hypothetical protein [Sinorhizobium mexicanum]QLL64267.1 hypothetical protein FKV68_22730 [Sinorhizobium mexicanum]